MKKRRYTVEFKTEAVKLVTEQKYSQSEAASSLGVPVKNLQRWIYESNNKGKLPAKANALSNDEQSELARLRKENKRLIMERDILKKAAAFFASESL